MEKLTKENATLKDEVEILSLPPTVHTAVEWVEVD